MAQRTRLRYVRYDPQHLVDTNRWHSVWPKRLFIAGIIVAAFMLFAAEFEYCGFLGERLPRVTASLTAREDHENRRNRVLQRSLRDETVVDTSEGVDGSLGLPLVKRTPAGSGAAVMRMRAKKSRGNGLKHELLVATGAEAPRSKQLDKPRDESIVEPAKGGVKEDSSHPAHASFIAEQLADEMLRRDAAAAAEAAAARVKVGWAYECMHGTATGAPGNTDLYPSPPDTINLDKESLRRHAYEVHAYLARYRGEDLPVMSVNGYGGPWIENRWIERFGQPHVRTESLLWWRQLSAHFEGAAPPGVTVLSEDTAANTVTLREPYNFDAFYPFVPLFARWEDVYWREHLEGKHKTRSLPDRLASGLADVIRQDVQYVTVTQRATGFLPASASVLAPQFQNVLVLSAGGNGHIGLPLLAQELSPQPLSRSDSGGDDSKSVTSAGPVRPGWRHKLSFIGQFHHHPLRDGMRAAVADAAPRLGWEEGRDYLISTPPQEEEEGVVVASDEGAAAAAADGALSNNATGAPSSPHWQGVMSASLLSLAPRGAGPTSFRLFEALQMGGATVPVYLHDGRPWLPYAWPDGGGPQQKGHLSPRAHPSLFQPGWLDWSHIALVIDIRDFPQWLVSQAPLLLADSAKLNEMRQAIGEARNKYFTYDAVLGHIAAFLRDPTSSDLRCTGAMLHEG